MQTPLRPKYSDLHPNKANRQTNPCQFTLKDKLKTKITQPPVENETGKTLTILNHKN
jgi:hypothetical protein